MYSQTQALKNELLSLMNAKKSLERDCKIIDENIKQLQDKIQSTCDHVFEKDYSSINDHSEYICNNCNKRF